MPKLKFTLNFILLNLLLVSSAAHAACVSTYINTTNLDTTLSRTEMCIENSATIITSDRNGISSNEISSTNTNTISGAITVNAVISAKGIYSWGALSNNINAGSITTTGGTSSHGIYSNGNSSTNINSGSIITHGPSAHGIDSFGNESTNINSGYIITHANNAHAISSAGSASININSGSISTEAGTGIFSLGTLAKNTNSGTVTNTGGSGIGISSYGSSSINSNSGIITNSGSAGHGIYSDNAFSTNTNSGSISTTGVGSYGIFSNGASSSNINSGSISTTGVEGLGIFSNNDTTITINSGTILTSGVSSDAIYSFGSYDNITNLGNISTIGFESRGIISFGANTTIKNFGSISTTNNNSTGISSWGANATIINTGTITTLGDDMPIHISADGIASYTLHANISNSGIIRTFGPNAYGIRSYASYLTLSNSGTIFSSGSNSHGIFLTGQYSVINNSGTIKATDIGAKAIYLESDIAMGTANQTILNLNKHSLITGDIFASSSVTSAKLNFNLGAGASYAYSITGPWTITDLNNRPMVTGSALAAGVGNITTASQSLYERTSQITQSLDDRLRTHDLKQQPSQDFWINTYYSDSGRGGQGLSGSNLSFNQYRSGITAGFNVKNSYTPTELIVNYEHGTLNIDQGNQGISSNSVMAGALFPDIKKLFTGTLSAKALVGYSDFSGDRKVLTNDVALNGSRNVTANYQSSHLTIGSAWTKTLYQTDKIILDTLVGIDLNTQHINSYSESDLFKWNGRTINQLQERVTLGMEMKPFVKPLTLFGRVGIERRDLISGENQHYAINNTPVSYNDSNQRNTYATLNAGAYYPLTPTVKAYAQVRYYDSTKDIDSLSGSIGISGQF